MRLSAPVWQSARRACALLGLACVASLAAAAEDTAALVREAAAYEHGEGLPKDQLKAAELYCLAARAGDAEAHFSLGWMYANGRGVQRNDGIAAALFQRAAQKGHAEAQRAARFVGEPSTELPECLRPARVMALSPAKLPPEKRKLVELVRQLAPTYNIDPELALAVIAIESNFNPQARSPKNAQGLMQLIPATAQRFRVKDLLDPADNIKGGLSYLRWLLSYYRGQVPLAVAAYNAGEGAVDRHRGVPPYPETQDYVRRIQSLFAEARHPYDDALAKPSPVLALPQRM